MARQRRDSGGFEMRERPNTEAVKRYREEHECGIQEAREALMREWRNDCLHDIRGREFYTVEQCGDAIKEISALLLETST
jgi:hypothetical protein